MADNADTSARKAQLQAQMDKSSERYLAFQARTTDAVKDALIRNGVISLSPEKILRFQVESEQWDETDIQFNLSISIGGSDFRITISQTKRMILDFSTSGISHRTPSVEDLTNTSEYYMTVAELLSNGPTLVNQLIETMGSLEGERKAIRSERDSLRREKRELDLSEQEKVQSEEQDKLSKALRADQIWIRKLEGRRNWELPQTLVLLMIDKVAGASFTATEMYYYTANQNFKDIETKRFYRAGKTPAQILTSGYAPTNLSYGEFQERIAKSDSKEWLEKLLGVEK